MGDFYESFGDDAKVIAKELQITLTSRGRDKEGEDMPLAGIRIMPLIHTFRSSSRKATKWRYANSLKTPRSQKAL